MTDQLISFNTAKLAKEKGFTYNIGIIFKPFGNYYNHLGELNGDILDYIKDNTKQCISAPTQSHLQKWLRENHKISVDVFSYTFVENNYVYRYKISQGYQKTYGGLGKYEVALEEGLKIGLNQIKI